MKLFPHSVSYSMTFPRHWSSAVHDSPALLHSYQFWRLCKERKMASVEVGEGGALCAMG